MNEYEKTMKEAKEILLDILEKEKIFKEAGLFLKYIFCDSHTIAKVMMHPSAINSCNEIVFDTIFHTISIFHFKFISHYNFKEGLYYDLFSAIKINHKVQEEIDA